MHAHATARSTGEHQKACYRVLVFGVLALFGPPAFGIPPSVYSAFYALLLVGYAVWGLRLTVLYHDDDSLGYLLALFDVALTLPLAVWGTESWMIGPLVGLWGAGVAATGILRYPRHLDLEAGPRGTIDAITGFRGPEELAPFVQASSSGAARRGGSYGLVHLRVCRFEELVCLGGRECADRAVAALGRRALREMGEATTAFRLRPDELAFVVADADGAALTDVARRVDAAFRPLVQGRKIDGTVGTAMCPHDGFEATELLRAATQGSRGSMAPATDSAPVRGTQVAVG
jgi:GGDEF domain-containing protein